MCIFSIKFVGECVFFLTHFSWVKKTHMYDHRYFLWFCETNRSVYFFRHTLARDQTTATSTVRGSFCCCCCCCCFIALPQSPSLTFASVCLTYLKNVLILFCWLNRLYDNFLWPFFVKLLSDIGIVQQIYFIIKGLPKAILDDFNLKYACVRPGCPL